MDPLRKNPHLYEINLMTWLNHLCEREGRKITLRNIPGEEWSNLKQKGMDLIWLMGVWHRSPYSRRRARNQPLLIEKCRSVLENFEMDDIVGSPYAIHRYSPDPALGSTDDLMVLKKSLEQEGLFLILDFVPNHTACDHPWIKQNPEWYIQGEPTEGENCRAGFFLAEGSQGKSCIAHGRDPYFPPWTDTAQIDHNNPKAMHALVEALLDISRYCHGLRCDMAMLVLREIFQKTWTDYIQEDVSNQEEFWSLAIENVGLAGRRYLWLAEVYWGLEQELLDLGFDYSYDKTFYDLVVSEDTQGLKAHLSAPVAFQERMIRFLENHDEQRAKEVFAPEKIQSAMVIHATLPGMRFWHHGQLEGNHISVPVQLRRGPLEQPLSGLKTFSKTLLQEVNHPVFHNGRWEMCETSGWPDNQSHLSLLAWCWRQGEERRLIIVNFSSSLADGHVRLPDGWLPEAEQFLCRDPLKRESYHRNAAEVSTSGLYVRLREGDFHFFRIGKG